MNELTRIINFMEQRNPQVTKKLLLLVYEELRFLATRKIAQEKLRQAHQATTLVHKAYLYRSERSRLAPVPNRRGKPS